MSKKKKEYEDDSGYTIIDMNVEGMPGYIKPEHKKNKESIAKLNLTKKEKRAIFWGSFKAVLPTVAFILVGFGIATLLMYLWLG